MNFYLDCSPLSQEMCPPEADHPSAEPSVSEVRVRAAETWSVPTTLPPPEPPAQRQRVSSLLQRANGGAVVVSEQARHRAEKFMSSIVNASDAHTAPSSSSSSSSRSSSAAPASAVVANATTTAVVSAAAGAEKARVSSLLQKASGASVLISERASERGAQVIAQAAPSSSSSSSSLLRTARGGSVTISDKARAAAQKFISTTMITVNNTKSDRPSESLPNKQAVQGIESVPSAIGDKTERDSQYVQTPTRDTVERASPVNVVAPLVSDTAAPSAAPTITPMSAVGVVAAAAAAAAAAAVSAAAGPEKARVSSLLPKASGASVLISERASERGAQVIAQAVPSFSSSSSSLLRTARGGSVTISDKARAAAQEFISTTMTTVNNTKSDRPSENMPNKQAVQDPVQCEPDDMVEGNLSCAARTTPASSALHFAPSISSAAAAATTASVATSTSSSLLLQRASGKTVTISAAAREKGEQWLRNVPRTLPIASEQPTNVPPVLHGQRDCAIQTEPVAESEKMSVNVETLMCILEKDDALREQLWQRLSLLREQHPHAQLCADADSYAPPLQVQHEEIEREIVGIDTEKAVSLPFSVPSSVSPCVPGVPPSRRWFLRTPRVDRHALLEHEIWPRDIALSPSPSLALSLSSAELLSRYVSLSETGLSLSLPKTQQRVGPPERVLVARSLDLFRLSPSLQALLLSLQKEYPALSLRWAAMQLNWILWTLCAHCRRHPELCSSTQSVLSLENVTLCLRRRVALYHYGEDLYGREGETERQMKTIENTNDENFDPQPSSERATKIGRLSKPIAQKQSRSLDNAQTHTPSRMHFLNKRGGAMSPLQRCCEIACFLWPLCLCVSISRGESGPTVQVTDGWWWSDAVLDKGMHTLLEKGLLKDGFKVIVFCATISPAESSSASALVKLQYNCVRLARADAPLGFVQPRFLSRGLSLKTLQIDGGPVFATRFEVLSLSPVFFKVKLIDQEGEAVLDGNILSSSELQWMRNKVDEVHEKQIALHLEDRFAREDYEAESNKRQRTSNDYSINFEPAYQMDVQSFQDALVLCEVSGALGWVRFPADQEDSADVSVKIAAGNKYLLTNVKVVKSPASSPLLALSGNSSLKCLSKKRRQVSVITPAKPTVAVQSQSSVVIHNRRREEFSTLSQLLRCAQDDSDDPRRRLSGALLSTKLVVVDWIEEPYAGSAQKRDNISSALFSSSRHQFEMRTLRVLAIDESFLAVEMVFPVFSHLVDKLPWLRKNMEIFAANLLVRDFDSRLEILGVSRCERTSIQCISSPNPTSSSSSVVTAVRQSPFSLSQSSPGRAPSAASTAASSSAKKKKFVTPRVVRKAVVTPSPVCATPSSLSSSSSVVVSSLSPRMAVLTDDERLRFAALRASQEFYLSPRLPGHVSLCAHKLTRRCRALRDDAKIVAAIFPQWCLLRLSCDVSLPLHPSNNAAQLVALCETTQLEEVVPRKKSGEETVCVVTLQKLAEPIELQIAERNEQVRIDSMVAFVAR